MPESVVEAAPPVTASPVVAGKTTATNSGRCKCHRTETGATDRSRTETAAANRCTAETTAADCGCTEATTAQAATAMETTAATTKATAGRSRVRRQHGDRCACEQGDHHFAQHDPS